MKRGKIGEKYLAEEKVWYQPDSENRIRAEVVKQSPMKTFTTIKFNNLERNVLTQLISR